MTDDRTLERDVRSALTSHAPAIPPNGLLRSFESRARPARRYPRWLALAKEPTMRIDSDITVGSPIFRVAAIALATVLLAVMVTGAAVAAAQLLQGPATIDVAQDGSGDTTTIEAALAKAADGSTIRIHPGTYAESVRVTKDVTLMGTDRDAVIVTSSSDVPWMPVGEVGLVETSSPWALRLANVDATVSDITLSGANSALLIEGGRPLLLNLMIEGVKPVDADGNPGSAVLISAGSEATIRNSHLRDSGPIVVFDRSEPDIDSNLLEGGASVYGAFGDGAMIRGNEISGAVAHGIRVMEPTTMRIERNHVRDAPSTGIYVGWGRSEGVDPLLVENVIVGARNAIHLESGAEPGILRNEVAGARTGINVRNGSPLIEGNVLRGNSGAIHVRFGQPVIEGNTLEENHWPLEFGAGARPTVSGNTFCGNVEEVTSYMPELAEANTVCD